MNLITYYLSSRMTGDVYRTKVSFYSLEELYLYYLKELGSLLYQMSYESKECWDYRNM